MRGIFFRGCVHGSLNCHSTDTTEPKKECGAEQPQTCTMTGPGLTIGFIEIIYVNTKKTNSMHFRWYQKRLLPMTNMKTFGGARGVMVFIVGNGHSETSSNPGTRLMAIHIALIPLGKVLIQLLSHQLWVNIRNKLGSLALVSN